MRCIVLYIVAIQQWKKLHSSRINDLAPVLYAGSFDLSFFGRTQVVKSWRAIQEGWNDFAIPVGLPVCLMARFRDGAVRWLGRKNGQSSVRKSNGQYHSQQLHVDYIWREEETCHLQCACYLPYMASGEPRSRIPSIYPPTMQSSHAHLTPGKKYSKELSALYGAS